MIVIFGTMAFTKQTFAQAREAASRLTVGSRKERGCLVYRFSEDISDVCVLNFYEEWESLEALEAHKATPHNLEFKQVLERLSPTSRRVKTYHVDTLANAL